MGSMIRERDSTDRCLLISRNLNVQEFKLATFICYLGGKTMPSGFVCQSRLMCAVLTMSALLGCGTFDDHRTTFPNVSQSNDVVPRPQAKPVAALPTRSEGSFGAVLGGITGKTQEELATTVITSDRKLVRTATLTLSTTNVDALLEKIRALATGSGGYVEESKFADDGHGEP